MSDKESRDEEIAEKIVEMVEAVLERQLYTLEELLQTVEDRFNAVRRQLKEASDGTQMRDIRDND